MWGVKWQVNLSYFEATLGEVQQLFEPGMLVIKQR